ncbi:MAG: lmo0937 family membrane protein [Bacteroidales bacterium]|nr:lmo0937 family membrane protein [Bacteroidales bacterium]MDZ4059039.1 lmo0937 family membrane protein [Bacteroidales bacterium]
MGNLLYILAIILIFAWLIGLVGFNLGGIIHILLVFAIIAILLRVIKGRRYR